MIERKPAFAPRETMPLSTQRAAPSIGDMLAAVVQKGVTAENVAALDKLADLYERMQKRDAETAFAQAFVELQKELPTIHGGRVVPDKQGNAKFVYANFDDIDAVVRPYCLKHGFTYSFRETGMAEGRVTMTMDLTHMAGHTREIPFTVRVGGGPPGTTESQNDMGGHTYAKRGALESGLSLRIVGDKRDPRMEGGPITADQADELERRVSLLNQDHKKFLHWLGAASYKEIAASKYAIADEFLAKKEKQ